MNKKILAAGCSFMRQRRDNIPQCEIAANILNFDIINLAHQGRGNNLIVRKLLENLEVEKFDLVIVGWSSPFRWDYTTLAGKPATFHMTWVIEEEKYWRHHIIDSDRTQFNQWAPTVVLLSEHLRNKKIPFIFFNSLPCWFEGDSFFHRYILNMKEFLRPIENQLDDIQRTQEWFEPGDKHPNQQNNIKWGEYISDHYQKIYGE